MIPNADLNQTDTQLLARLLAWARDPAISRDHMLFMVCESFLTLHEELRRPSSRWAPFEVARPNEAERRAFTEWRIEQCDSAEWLDPAFGPAELARASGLLNREQIDDVIFRGQLAGRLSAELARQAKADIVAQEFGDVVQLDDARFRFDRVGGYAYIKEGLHLYTVAPWLKRGRLTTSGMLMMGPAGTGKTQLAEALAGEAGVPFVVVKLSRILGQYVGNSERNWERLERALFALGASVVFIDEIDQVFKRGGGSEGGSQVDNRIFAAFLAFMENPDRLRAGILVVAATNRPDLVDSALRSRLGLRVPVLLPTADDRAEVLGALGLEFLGVDITTDDTIDSVLGVMQGTEGWSGRDLRGLVLKALQLVDALELAPGEALRRALSRMRPETSADTATQTALALRFCSDLDFLPPERIEEARQQLDTQPADEPAEQPAADRGLRRGRL